MIKVSKPTHDLQPTHFVQNYILKIKANNTKKKNFLSERQIIKKTKTMRDGQKVNKQRMLFTYQL